MQNWMRENRKKLLAIVTVFLMLAFVFTSQFGPKQGRDGDYSIGTIGDMKVTPAMAGQAYALFQYIGQNVVVPRRDQTGQERYVSINEALLGRTLVEQAHDNNLIVFLLQEEARRMGISVSEAELNNVLQEVQVIMRDPGNDRTKDRLVLFENVSQEMADNLRAGMTGLMLIQKSFQRAAGVMKVSQPIIERDTALQLQEVKLKFIEFPSAEFAAQVQTPTADQLKAQFDQYADTLPGELDARTNPAGYGYKYPDRVKIQYLAVDQNELKRAIRAGKSEYDWEVAAQKFYRRNGALFPTSQPATTQPTDSFSLAPTSRPANGPTTRPFEEVREEIIARLVDPEVAKLSEQIERRILSAMAGDFAAYRSAQITSAATSAPATQPRSTMGVDYVSLDYLNALAADIQKQTGVVLKVVSLGEQFLDESAIAKLPDFSGIPGIEQYIIGYAEAFLKPGERRRDGMLALYEPSRSVRDPVSGNAFVFRIVAADPSHKPASIDEVKDRVEKDFRAQQALNLAKDAATKIKDLIPDKGFDAAALATNKRASETGYLSGLTGWSDPSLTLTDPSRALLQLASLDLLAQVKAAPDKPATAIAALPEDGKVVLATLLNTRPLGNEVLVHGMQQQNILQTQQRQMQAMYSQWFAYDEIKKRLGFTDRATLKSEEKG